MCCRLHKEFTSFDVAAVTRELREVILDSRVNNIYQINAKTLLLKLHKTNEPAFRLIIEAGRRLNLTAYSIEKPQMPPTFCMALRKYLQNAWLTNVEQHEFERVVVLLFKSRTNALQLVMELFGDGNIILVGEEGRILQALVYKRMRDRSVVRNEVFRFPPSSGKNPFKISRDELSEAFRSFGDVEIVRAIARFLSIGGIYAEEILLKAGIDKTKPCSTMSSGEIQAFFDSLRDSLNQVARGELEPCVVLDEMGDCVDVVPFRLRRYQIEGFKLQMCNSFNEALDEYYVRASAIEQATVGTEVEELEREAARLKRVIADQEEAKVETEAEVKRNQHVGNTIYEYMNDLQVLMDRFLEGKQTGRELGVVISDIVAGKQADEKPSVFFDSFSAKGLFLNVVIEGLKFSLDLHKTLFENASFFYERGKRARQKLEGIKTALADSNRKLEEIEAKTAKTRAAKLVQRAPLSEELAKRRIKHKKWFEKFRWFISSDGFLVIAGRDATSNEVLIKKHAENGDIVFHADIVGAPFVVIETQGRQPSEQCLHEAGEFAAAYSRGWREGFGSVDVYWVSPKQLSKTGSSGESVGHGAFVVRGGRNWLRGVTLKLAVGVVEEDGAVRFIGGPVNSVKIKTQNYVIIVPGALTSKELFKRILGLVTRKIPKDMQRKILRISVEEIRDFIPFGKGNLAE